MYGFFSDVDERVKSREENLLVQLKKSRNTACLKVAFSYDD